jgi:cytoskeletal protein CcmA (bactofilin family)
MAISWKDQSSKTTASSAPEPARFDAPAIADIHPSSNGAAAQVHAAPSRAPEREVKESLIASDITIEGKIEGAGHIRIAGRFKGDVNVQGNLTIETGAKLTGGVRANKVIIAGELEGNIEAAQRVELLDSGVLIGDVKAGTMTVAAGSRMRGQMDFGWDEKDRAGKTTAPVAAAASKTEVGIAS